MALQSVVFEKEYGWTPTLARKWIKKYGLRPIKRVDRTVKQLRYRMSDPDQYERIRTHKIKSHGKFTGILYILGYN